MVGSTSAAYSGDLLVVATMPPSTFLSLLRAQCPSCGANVLFCSCFGTTPLSPQERIDEIKSREFDTAHAVVALQLRKKDAFSVSDEQEEGRWSSLPPLKKAKRRGVLPKGNAHHNCDRSICVVCRAAGGRADQGASSIQVCVWDCPLL